MPGAALLPSRPSSPTRGPSSVAASTAPRASRSTAADESVGRALPSDPRRVPYAIKAEIRAPHATTFAFTAQKTMYGGKRVAVGDEIFLFASENEGGAGLIAAGVVAAVEGVARTPGLARQTPRVSLVVRRTADATRPMGRRELKACADRTDGRPETELNFKLYRQATNKIVGLSEAAAALLRACCGGASADPRAPARPPLAD